MLASADRAGTIRTWRVSFGWPIRSMSLPTPAQERALTDIAFPASFTVVSVGKDGNERIWDASDGRPLRDPISGPDGELTAVASSPVAADIRTAVAGAQGDIRIISLDRDTTVEQACEVANRDLADGEWRHYVGDGPPRTCLSR